MRWLTAFPLLLLVTVSACSTSGGELSPDPEPEPPKTPLETAQRYLDFWQEQEYGEMYALVSVEARAAVRKDDLMKRYSSIAEEATITGIDLEIGPNVVEEDTDIPVDVTLHTTFFGDIHQGQRIPLVQDEITLPAAPPGAAAGRMEWRVQWSPA